MRVSYTKEEAQGLANSGKAFLFEKSIVLPEPHFPEYLWDNKYQIYKLTTFVPVNEVKPNEAKNRCRHCPFCAMPYCWLPDADGQP